MRFLFCSLLAGAALLSATPAARAQQPTPVAAAAPAALSDDSVRVMAALVQSSVRQLRGIYFESDNARAVQLINAALVEIPALNQRLSHYTASLPREQQQLLAQRLRQQPWQIELQTLMRSPQVKSFDARAAQSPELKAAAERLHASGFAGTARVAAPAPAVAAAEPTGTIVFLPAKGRKPAPANALASTKPAPASRTSALSLPAGVGTGRALSPAAASAPAPPTSAATATVRHTVQKGDTLFSICRQYGVSPAQVRSWNHKQEDGVKIGEVLVLSQP